MLAFNFGSSRGELGFGSWIKSHVETISGSNLLIGNRRATLMTTTRRRPCIDVRGCAPMLTLCMPYSEVEEFEANFHQEALKGLGLCAHNKYPFVALPKTRIAKIAAIGLEPVDAWTSPFGMFESTYDRRLDSHNEDHEFILDAAWTVCGLHPLNVSTSIFVRTCLPSPLVPESHEATKCIRMALASRALRNRREAGRPSLGLAQVLPTQPEKRGCFYLLRSWHFPPHLVLSSSVTWRTTYQNGTEMHEVPRQRRMTQGDAKFGTLH
ncbi:uncharacterized protein SEPMUDRAFT_135776 [Sphaerulina musiva SO2202]|uniref:Uncharacterized protein n=1 Tax=Sphaerulina musiva (strain SO2202) TaxID=692275 RepID=N1QDD8_SPHMS|nr:uncharacterized protein SEPMUDRAFT_135776 [Sphaerulina musiva SO2202]EMF09356.1 hypothetical protein SEPMUDRAFT_135776 [Sphaerulina musiva SO2202]